MDWKEHMKKKLEPSHIAGKYVIKQCTQSEKQFGSFFKI